MPIYKLALIPGQKKHLKPWATLLENNATHSEQAQQMAAGNIRGWASQTYRQTFTDIELCPLELRFQGSINDTFEILDGLTGLNTEQELVHSTEWRNRENRMRLWWNKQADNERRRL